jgi:hypothetical protein
VRPGASNVVPREAGARKVTPLPILSTFPRKNEGSEKQR